MSRKIAHDLSSKDLSSDIELKNDVTFSLMGLSQPVLKGLLTCGFHKPSPIQFKSIPLGRCGFDLIVKAKSGTGKTAVFGVIALEMIDININQVQVIVIAPTREIAIQNQEVISAIGCEIKGLKVCNFIGGKSIKSDKKNVNNCHIAIGAPGRIRHLIEEDILKMNAIRLIVLDEADKLLEENFQKDINYVFSKLPDNKQVIAASATYPDGLENFLETYMQSPKMCCPDDEGSIPLGLKQFACILPSHPNVTRQRQIKIEELVKILKQIPFKQCLVFSNYQIIAQSVCNMLKNKGFPKAEYVNGSQTMDKRIDSMKKLKNFEYEIIITTDVLARGIDAQNVNLVINLDIPRDLNAKDPSASDPSATYIHRIGRAGRYGSRGLAINLISEKELNDFQNLLSCVGGPNYSIFKLPENYSDNLWNDADDVYERIHAIQSIEQENTSSKTIKKHEPKLMNDKVIDKEDRCLKNSNSSSEASKEKYKSFKNSSHWREYCHKDNLQELKITQSVDPSLTEKLNEGVNFGFNFRKVPKSKLSKTETDDLISFFNVKYKRKSTLNSSNDSLGFEIIHEKETLNVEEIDIQKSTDELKSHCDNSIFETQDFQFLLKLKNNLEKNIFSSSEDSTENSNIHEAACWKYKLKYEIVLLEKFFSKTQHNSSIHNLNFYEALHHFYCMQQKALMCIYPEIRNEEEIKDTYLYSEDNANINLLNMYGEIENFKSLHRNSDFKEFTSYFPYPMKIGESLPNLMMSENDIKKYKLCVEFLKTNSEFFSEWFKIRTLLNGVKNEKIKQMIVENIISEQNMTYDKLRIIFNNNVVNNNNDAEVSDDSSESEESSSVESVASERNNNESEICDVQISSEQTKILSIITDNISSEKIDVEELSEESDENCFNEDVNTSVENVGNEELNHNDYTLMHQSDTYSFNVHNNYNHGNIQNSEIPYCNQQYLPNNINVNHSCYGNVNYGESLNSEDHDLDLFFSNLRIQTDQIHMQEYTYHMFYGM